MSDLVPLVSADDYTQGPDDAPVTLVEYGDFQCPDCGIAFSIVRELQAQRGNQLRFVFRQFPLTDLHRHAEAAAEAAEAAGAQGQFWAMHDLLFEHQQALSEKDLLFYADEIGLDMTQFQSALADHAYAARVRSELAGGIRSGVRGTPTFFINGRRHDNSYDVETLTAAIAASKENAQ